MQPINENTDPAARYWCRRDAARLGYPADQRRSLVDAVRPYGGEMPLVVVRPAFGSRAFHSNAPEMQAAVSHHARHR